MRWVKMPLATCEGLAYFWILSTDKGVFSVVWNRVKEKWAVTLNHDWRNATYFNNPEEGKKWVEGEQPK